MKLLSFYEREAINNQPTSASINMQLPRRAEWNCWNPARRKLKSEKRASPIHTYHTGKEQGFPISPVHRQLKLSTSHYRHFLRTRRARWRLDHGFGFNIWEDTGYPEIFPVSSVKYVPPKRSRVVNLQIHWSLNHSKYMHLPIWNSQFHPTDFDYALKTSVFFCESATINVPKVYKVQRLVDCFGETNS